MGRMVRVCFVAYYAVFQAGSSEEKAMRLAAWGALGRLTSGLLGSGSELGRHADVHAAWRPVWRLAKPKALSDVTGRRRCSCLMAEL